MGQRYKFNVKWSKRETRIHLDDVELDIVFARLLQLARHQRRGEGRGVNRTAEFRGKQRNGSDMVLMAVGQEQSVQRFLFFQYE